MKVRLGDEFHEDMGNVLWLHFEAFDEPFEVYFGSSLDSDFEPDYWTHFVEIDSNEVIRQAQALNAANAKINAIRDAVSNRPAWARAGQAAFNYTLERFPEYANSVRGSALDPYHSDLIIDLFYTGLRDRLVNSAKSEVQETAKATAYYKSVTLRDIPLYVPARIRVLQETFGDPPFLGAGIAAGEYECQCNKYGAVSVTDRGGEPLGLRLDEFEVVEWVKNPKAD